MRRLALALWLLAGCGKPQREPALFKTDCGDGKGYRYCIYTDSNGKPSDTTLYYLHGKGDSELQWGQSPIASDMVRHYRAKGLPAPTVVSISFGKIWVLTERGTSVGAGLLERFVEQAMPAAEARTGSPRKRVLWGLSMGGFNAAQLLLKRPSLWKAAVLSCPAVTPLSPFGPEKERRDYAKRTGAAMEKLDYLLGQQKRVFPTRPAWDRHDPLRLAREASDLPPTLVACGDADEWGFYEGSRRLSETLASQGQRVRFDTIPKGRHCAVETQRVLDFLLLSTKE
ncbi:MAG: alpha/beta hydrolase [Elusimicrobia bacterium]|nr:alpha/beta hydrolase [Elusimicrobiota bacterium]